jgi:hypothetical protein
VTLQRIDPIRWNSPSLRRKDFARVIHLVIKLQAVRPHTSFIITNIIMCVAFLFRGEFFSVFFKLKQEHCYVI